MIKKKKKKKEKQPNDCESRIFHAIERPNPLSRSCNKTVQTIESISHHHWCSYALRLHICLYNATRVSRKMRRWPKCSSEQSGKTMQRGWIDRLPRQVGKIPWRLHRQSTTTGVEKPPCGRGGWLSIYILGKPSISRCWAMNYSERDGTAGCWSCNRQTVSTPPPLFPPTRQTTDNAFSLCESTKFPPVENYLPQTCYTDAYFHPSTTRLIMMYRLGSSLTKLLIAKRISVLSGGRSSSVSCWNGEWRNSRMLQGKLTFSNGWSITRVVYRTVQDFYSFSYSFLQLFFFFFLVSSERCL